MYRASMITVAALVLVACATVDDLRHKEPVSSFPSSRDAQKASACVASAWDAQRIGLEANGTSLTRAGDGFIVASPATGYPAEIAEILPSNSGSTVVIHAQAALDVGGRTKKRIQAAMACK